MSATGPSTPRQFRSRCNPYLLFFGVFFFTAFLLFLAAFGDAFFAVFLAFGPKPTQLSTVSTTSFILLFFFAMNHSLKMGKEHYIP